MRERQMMPEEDSYANQSGNGRGENDQPNA